jgi:hypothetical protein
MDKKLELVVLIKEFCFSTIKGHESGLYKSFSDKLFGDELGLDTLQNEHVFSIIAEITVNYFNTVYVSLIKRDDPYIINRFDKMCEINNHSAICLLNIMFAIVINLHGDFNRQNLNIDSYKLYMKSIDNELDSKMQTLFDKLMASISHTCKGMDILKCDPNIPMFSVKT